MVRGGYEGANYETDGMNHEERMSNYLIISDPKISFFLVVVD